MRTTRVVPFLFCCSCLSLTGCSKLVTPTNSVSDVPTVQRSAQFAGITTAYRAGAYQQALLKVEALSRRSDLSPADRLYLERQATICRTAMQKGTVIASPAPSLPAPVAASASSDCGPRALLLVCRELHVPASLSALARIAGTKPGVGSNLAGLSKAAESVGLSAKGVQVDADALRRVPTPALAWVDGNHFLAVTKIHEDVATVEDPNQSRKEEVAISGLLQRSGGILLLVKRKAPSVGETRFPL